MNVIVIGCDASGKGTLIEALMQKNLFKSKYKVVKGSSFELTSGKNSEELFEAFMELGKMENVIFDRFAYCNYVYAPLFKDYDRITLEGLDILEQEIEDNTLIVYLYADKEVIAERFNTRGEEYVDESQIQDILNSYRFLLGRTKLDYLTFDTGKIDVEAIARRVNIYVHECIKIKSV